MGSVGMMTGELLGLPRHQAAVGPRQGVTMGGTLLAYSALEKTSAVFELCAWLMYQRKCSGTKTPSKLRQMRSQVLVIGSTS